MNKRMNRFKTHMTIFSIFMGLVFAQTTFAAEELMLIGVNNNTEKKFYSDVFFVHMSGWSKPVAARGGIVYSYDLAKDGLSLSKPFELNFSIQVQEKFGFSWLCHTKKLFNASGILNPIIEINVNSFDSYTKACDVAVNLREDHE